MTNSAIDRSDPQVRKALANLQQQLCRALPAGDERDDLIRELQAHVLDAAERGNGSPGERVTRAITDLGPLSAFAPELAAELALQQSAARGSPLAIAGLLATHLGRDLLKSAVLMICALAMLFALLLLCCAIAALWLPDAGLYWNGWSDFTLSFEAQQHAPKVATAWFVPGALLVAIGMYLGASRIMVWTLRRTKSG